MLRQAQHERKLGFERGLLPSRKRFGLVTLASATVFAAVCAPLAYAQEQVHTEANKKHKNTLDIEKSMVYTGYNDIAVPASTDNRFSLKNDLTSDPVTAVRFRYGRYITDKHWVGVLIAPLTVKATGTFDKDIDFRGDTYKANTPIDATYRFDSYRLLYRYTFVDRADTTFSFGGAIKVRDAEIRLENNTANTPRTNLGYVPLLSFNYTYKPTDKLSLMVDGEALAAPQGRAEDVFFGASYQMNDHVALKGGYRILEGGADNEKLYTFSLFHYASAGVVLSF